MRVPLPSVQQQPQPSTTSTAPRITPQGDATGQQLQAIGSGLANTGAAMSSIGDRLQLEWDDARVKDADNKVADLMRTEVNGYLQLVGKDATGTARGKVFESIDAGIRKASTVLTNARQQEAFQRAAQARLQRAKAQADDHEASQLRVYRIGQTQARTESFLQDALTGLGTKDFDVNAEMMRREATQLAALQGLGAEQTAALVKSATTRLHSAAIDQLLTADQPSAASAYLKQHRDEIDAIQVTKLQSAVEAKSDSAVAKTTALELGQNVPTMLGRVGEANSMFQSGKITAEQHSKLLNELVAQDQLASRARAERRVQLSDAYTSALDENRRRAAAGEAQLGGIEDVLDPMLVEELKNSGLYGLAERYASEGRWVTTRSGNQMLAALDATQLKNKPWTEVQDYFRPVLDDRDLAFVRKQWEGVNEKPQGPKPYDLNTDRDFVNMQIARLTSTPNIKPSEMTQAQIDERARIIDMIEQRVNASSTPSAPATRETVRKVVDELAMEKMQEKGGGGDTVLSMIEPARLNDYQVVYTDPSDGQRTVATVDELQDPAVMARAKAIGDEKVRVLNQHGRREEAAKLAVKLSNDNPHTLAMILAQDKKAQSDAAAAAERESKLEVLRQQHEFETKVKALVNDPTMVDMTPEQIQTEAWKRGLSENSVQARNAKRVIESELAAKKEAKRQAAADVVKQREATFEAKVADVVNSMPHETAADLNAVLDELEKRGVITTQQRPTMSYTLIKQYWPDPRATGTGAGPYGRY